MTYKYWETDELQHSGVKGMKWGVRKEARKLKRAQRKWDRAYRRNYVKAYNKASEHMNANIDSFNKKWESVFGAGNWSLNPRYNEYIADYEDTFDRLFATSMKDIIGERPR